MAVFLALLLPTLLGVAGWCWLCGRPRDAFGWCAALGAGYLAGVLGWGVLLGAFGAIATDVLFVRLAPWLALAGALALATAWRYAGVAPPAPVPAAPATRAEQWAIGFALLLLALAAVVILPQALQLPTLSWDAWNAWLAKSKAWYFAGAMRPVVGFDAWRDGAAGASLTATAHYYPEALPRLALWMASAAGGWRESAVHAPWPLAWLALGLACFGYLGLAGCRAAHATVTAAALLLLPLVTAHAVLAGYSDLWLAALLMLAGFHFAAWVRGRERRHLVATLLFASLGVAAKLEGAVWLACLLAAVVLAWLPRRWRWSLLLAGPLLWTVALPFGGLRLPLPGLGVVRFAWGLVEIPTRGTMTLAWRPVLDEFAQALFLLPNWSLLWYLAPLLLLCRWRSLQQRCDLAALGGFLALGYAFLFVLFFLTDAAAWAENFTSLNRVLLHIVPVTVAWLSLLWAAPSVRDRAPPTAG
jgi:hypothetical protein